MVDLEIATRRSNPLDGPSRRGQDGYAFDSESEDVGGLVTSTALTLLVIPALYRWFAAVPKLEAEALAAD